ncbi:hypothetical protein AMJ82_11540, partial [candidate division TA06 bacterium SM23_40]
LVSDRARRILESISEADLEEANLRDKAVAASIMIEKRQLLSGEPTEIIDMQSREHVNVLVQALVVEAKRRGIDFDVTGDVPRAIDAEVVP